MKTEKQYIEQINALTVNLNLLVESNTKLVKEKKSLMSKVDILKKEIERRRKEINIINKQININKEKSNNEKEAINNNNGNKNKINVTSSEEIIRKQFNQIQRNYNLNIHEKLKSNIETLLSMQKVLKVNYIIVKKLDIKEDFLKINRLTVSSEYANPLK